MKRYLLFVIAFVCASIGLRAQSLSSYTDDGLATVSFQGCSAAQIVNYLTADPMDANLAAAKKIVIDKSSTVNDDVLAALSHLTNATVLDMKRAQHGILDLSAFSSSSIEYALLPWGEYTDSELSAMGEGNALKFVAGAHTNNDAVAEPTDVVGWHGYSFSAGNLDDFLGVISINNPSLFNSPDEKTVTLSGQLDNADLQNANSVIGSAQTGKVGAIDLSGATVPTGTDYTDLGYETTQAIVLPSSATVADIYSLQQKYYQCVGYYTDDAKKRLDVYSQHETITKLKGIVNNETCLSLLPIYSDEEGTMSTDCYLTFINADADFITHLGELPVASIDMKWINGATFTNMTSQLLNLNSETHYLIIPSNSNSEQYQPGWDPVNLTYPSTIWAVSSYFGTGGAYSQMASFGNRTYQNYFLNPGSSVQATPTEMKRSANFTKILNAGTGKLAQIIDLMSDEQRTADVNAIYGTLSKTELSAIRADVMPSTYLDFAGAVFNNCTIKDLGSSAVEYIDLPHNTDISTIKRSDFGSNVKEALCINTSNGDIYGYSSANSEGTLEHLLSYDTSWFRVPGADETGLVGTTYTSTSKMVLEGTFNDVFGEMLKVGAFGARPATVDLSRASFPTFTDNIFVGTAPLTDANEKENGFELFQYSLPMASEGEQLDCQFDKVYKGPVNGLANISVLNPTMKSVSLPVDAATSVLPTASFYDDTHRCLIEGELVIPENIKNIGAYAFNDAEKVTVLTILGATHIGPAAFQSMKRLATVNLPSTLKKIPDFAFSMCPALKVVDLPEGLEEIGIAAFKANSGETTQIDAIRFPNTLKRIDCHAFVENHHLTVLSFPASLEYIGTQAFWNCQYIEDVYFLGTTPPVCAQGAFDGRTTGQGQGRSNTEYESECGVSRYYYTTGKLEDGFGDIRAIMHYPKVSTVAGYSEYTDYASDYAQYQTDLATYNAAVADKADEVAEYEEKLAAWNAVKDMSLNWSAAINPATIQDVRSYPNNDYYVKVSDGGYKQLEYGWQTNATGSYPIDDNTFFTLKDGEYSIVEITNADEAQTYINSTGLYVWTDDPVFRKITDAEKQALIAGEPTPVEGIPTRPTAPVAYTKSGDEYIAYSGVPVSGITYYKATSGSPDLYGALYTDLERNATWTQTMLKADENGMPICGEYYDGDETAKWPPAYHSDGTKYDDAGDLYAGVKEFLMVAGFSVNPDDPTPVQEIDHIKKDIWYTVCFPFDLTDKQLRTTFGPAYELAEFSGVVPKEDGNGIVLQFKRDVTSLKAHKAYMIHPASRKVQKDANGNPILDSNGKTIPAETTFTLVDINETDEDHNMSTKDIFTFNVENGNSIVNPGKAVADYQLAGATASASTGDNFVFTAVSHSNLYDFENNTGTRVLLPQWCYFLGMAEGATYPRFYRQAASDATDRTGGLWRKNVAVVLPPGTVYVEQTEGDELASGTDFISWKSGFMSNKYIYQAKSAGAKQYAFSSFEIEFVDNVNPIVDNPTGIEEINDTQEFAVPAHLQNRVYNINGQYVGNSLKGLASGIYIVNGKKFVVQ